MSRFPSFIFCGLIALTLLSCNGNDEQVTNEQSETPEVKVIDNNYRLVVNESKADWERTLDQKATKQKVKMFGSMVDVELGAVKLTTNGNVDIKDGELVTSNDKINKATVIFDMTSLKFAKEKGNGLFDVVKYPNSTLEITNIMKDSVGYKAIGALTIQEVTKPTDIHFEMTKTANSHLFTGTFVINTLDFPLRDQVKAKDVNKDEIKIKFELKYLLSE